MDVKKEVIYGIIGSILIMLLVLFYRLQYSNMQLEFQKTQTKKMNGTITSSTTILLPTLLNDTNLPAQPTAAQKKITLSADEVSKHNIPNDCWLIIGNSVYSVSSYLDLHPGGRDEIIRFCGQDATQAYTTRGGGGSHSDAAAKQLSSLIIGSLNATVSLPVL